MLLGLGITLAMYGGSAVVARVLPAGWRRVLGQLIVLAGYLVAVDLLAQRQHGLGLRRFLIGTFLSLTLGRVAGSLWRDRAALSSALRSPYD